MRNKPIDISVLDYLIVSSKITGRNGQLSQDDSTIIALYNYLGRWFSKSAILERIDHMDKLRNERGGNLFSSLKDQNYFINGRSKHTELLLIRSLSWGKEFIYIDSEILVEINNLCRRNKPCEVHSLLKYLNHQMTVDKSIDENSMLLTYSSFMAFPYPPKGLPRDMVSFWWKQNDELNAVCYRSNTNDSSFIEAFKLDIFEAGNIIFSETGNGNINREAHLNNVLNYSGKDYTLVFRLKGETITCGRPPKIKHDYALQPITLKSPIFTCTSQNPSIILETTEKYYDLYRLDNKKAKQALKASGFNLDALDVGGISQ